MSQQLSCTHRSRLRLAQLAVVGVLAAASGLSLSAGSTPIRLLGVSAQGNAVLIESTEPAAYVVKRPDSLTVLVELRNVSVASASNVVERRDPIKAVTLEQGSGDDGQAVARVRVTLSRPLEYAVRSARNLIRLELTPPARAAATDVAALLPAAPRSKQESATAPQPSSDAPAATSLERVRSSRTLSATTITLSGNGRLIPTEVTEAENKPRRLLLDFPNVSSKAPTETYVEGQLVKRVRVAGNGRIPPTTRVAMEVAEGATYHVERAGESGSDLAVVFEPPLAASTSMLTMATPGVRTADPEPDIPLEQAIANAAAITPKDLPKDTPAEKPIASASPQASRVNPPAEAPPVPVPARTTTTAARQPSGPPAAQTSPLQVPPSAPRANQQIITGAPDKQYKGTPITLDFSGADLRSVLRYFNEISGLNIIIDPSVPATPIDVVLRDVPWDQAFETLLRTHKLGYVAEGTIVRIAPLSVLAEEEGDRRKLAEAKALAGDLRVQTFSLSYAKAGDLSPLLVKSALSQRGQIQVDARTNTIIITDLPDRLQTVSALLGALDRPEPQVEVEARVVQTTREFAKSLGVQWGLNGRVTPAVGNTTGLAFPNNGTLSGRTGASNSPADTRATANDTTAYRGEPRGPGRVVGNRPGAGSGQRRVQHRCRADRTRAQRQGTHSLDPATDDPEQRRGGSHAGSSDSDSDRCEQYRDRQLQGCGADAPGHAADHVGKHRDHADHAGERDARLQPSGQRHPADRHPARPYPGAGGRWGDDDHRWNLCDAANRSRTSARQGCTGCRCSGWLFKRDTTSDESRELLIFITPRIIRG